MSPKEKEAGTEETAANAAPATGEIRPDPDYEFRRQAIDLVQEWQSHDEDTDEHKQHREALLPRIRDLVRHNLTQKAEVEACDILMDIERVDMLTEMAVELPHMDFQRICLYLMSCVPYMPDPDNMTLVDVAKKLYSHFHKRIEALRCAIKANDVNAISEIFNNCSDNALKMQMALILGRQQVFMDIEEPTLQQLNANSDLYRHFMNFARELDLMTPKAPDDVYKTQLEPSRPFNAQAQKNTPLQNLASSFVNGFVNASFGTDALFKDEKSTIELLGKHKDWAAFSTAATFGLIHHWNIDGLNNFTNHMNSRDVYIKAGTLLAAGIVFAGVQDPDVDPASALLLDQINSDQIPMRVASTFGLGLAYANCKRESVVSEKDGVVQQLREVIGDEQPSANAEVKALASLSLGLILVGTGMDSNEIVGELITYLMAGADLKDSNMRFVALGIGLIYLGKQDECDETILEPLRALPKPFGDIASILVEICAYAGTGNVLKIQEMLHVCSERPEPKDVQENKTERAPPGAPLPDITAPPAKPTTAAPTANGAPNAVIDIGEEDQPEPAEALTAPTTAASSSKSTTAASGKEQQKKAESCLSQSVAVIGISLVAMGEEIGSAMALRLFGQLYRYGEPVVRRAVPLALALLSPSNPQLVVIETLSKYSHDSDAETARNAIFALGLVGAGTNNARVLATLRQLAGYHSRDQKTMMLLRISQGLVHMGKGTMTLNPFHSDRQLMCPAAVAALFSTCVAFIDSDQTILNGRQHYLLFTLVPAIQPRMLITVVQDPENPTHLIQKSVQVRVGQAVDVVAQAGQPRTITGFQTHTTPVLLGYGERAELADEEYVPQTPILEGIVILKKAEADEKMEH